MSNRTTFTLRRIATDAVLVALFYGLSLLSVEIGGVKITFDSLPVMICAMLFGPVDGFLVGFLGAFLEQMIKYGLTATTLLWVLPAAIRGLFVGTCARLMKKQMSELSEKKRPYAYFLVCLISGLIVSTLNTLVFYVDAKLFGYYEYHMIFGIFWLRLVLGAAASVVSAVVALPVIGALKRANFVPNTARKAKI